METRTMVVFAAPSRVVDDLTAAAAAFGADREVVVCRELTKAHEEVFRGTLETAAARWAEDVEPRGEFTVVVAGAPVAEPEIGSLLAEVTRLTDAGSSLSTAVREVAGVSGASRGALYEHVLRSRDGA